ncbi:MAG: molybdate ABC transporter substrate-binding protein [Deltaproteobacteria bacterium]|nr:molybdate ABC transporter substrate-binding protein [Deltaproteobacteria bacterium]
MKLVTVLLLACGAAACRGGSVRSGDTVRVVAAASLRDALGEVEAAFERKHPGMSVEVVFTSSGAAVEQLVQGAPFEVFLSADGKHVDEVVRRGLATPENRRVYARGRLALWIPSRVGVVPQGLSALEDPRVRRVAIANPDTAPYGRAAREALVAAGLWERIQGRLVFGQDIAQAAQQAQVAADAGLLALSLVLSPALRESGAYWVVPSELHGPLDQVLVLLRETPASRAFVEFLLGEEARGILARYGYEGTR